MARVVLLDAGPLGLACVRPGDHQGDALRAWLRTLETAGAEVIVPAVADYEVRRELVRVGATAKLRRLTLIRARLDYLPVSESAWEKAAEFWASVRNAGAPTAGPQDLDADAILAGQAATAGRRGDTIMIATTNARHLGRFPGIDARFWAAIA